MVELAIILLPLAVIVFGIVDLGRSYELGNRLANSAREAGAVLTYSPTAFCSLTGDGTSASERARAEDASFGTDGSYKGITVTLTHNGATTTIYTETSAACVAYAGTRPVSGDTLTVTATYNFTLITPLIGKITGSPIVMKKSVSVRVQ